MVKHRALDPGQGWLALPLEVEMDVLEDPLTSTSLVLMQRLQIEYPQ